MMLQLFLMFIMLTLAAFEVIIISEEHFVARSVHLFESSVREHYALDFLLNHCIGRLASDASFIPQLKMKGSVDYTVPLVNILGSDQKDVTGHVTCSSSGETAFVIVATLRKGASKKDMEILNSDTVDVQWDQKHSSFLIHHRSLS